MTKNLALWLTLSVLLTVSAFTFAQQQQPASAAVTGSARYNQSGDRIVDYFDVHAADIRSVLRQLSAYSGTDIISGDAVKATVSLTVSNKSWREILTILCMVHGFAYAEERGFIYVMSREDAAKRGITAGSVTAQPSGGGAGLTMAADPAEALLPLMREVIPLRYTTAAEMSDAITPFLSERGKLTTIQHTNAIIVVDTDEYLKQVKGLIGQIDIQTAQISISCKIIEVSSDVLQNLNVSGRFADANSNVAAGQFWGRTGGGSGTDGMPLFQSTMHTLNYGVLSPAKFGIALEYLFEDNKAELVAQPQITTLNNKEAKILIAEQRPINRKDEADNTITEMVSAGTQLTVTPYVSGDGKIMLTLNASKESFANPEGTNLRQQNAQTTVLVSNGETVVIAGLTSNEKREGESGIPILKNIPIIGNLFKNSSKLTKKMDLMIFVTPHIIHPGI